MRHRPVFTPATGLPVFFRPSRGACGTQGLDPAHGIRHHVLGHMRRHQEQIHGRSLGQRSARAGL